MIEFFRSLLTEVAPVWLVLLAAIVSGVIPLCAEAIITATSAMRPQLLWPVVICAAIGQQIACMVIFGLAYLARRSLAPGKGLRWLSMAGKHGAPTMLAAGLPFVGDAVLLACGALHTKPIPSFVWCGLGIVLRLAIVALAASAVF